VDATGAAARFGIAARGRGGETVGTWSVGKDAAGRVRDGSGSGTDGAGWSCSAVATGAMYAEAKATRLMPTTQ
jgi:hypothetical protein